MKKFALVVALLFVVMQLQGFILITSLYSEDNPERIDEYVRCMENNAVHPLINEIVVVYDISHQPGTLLEYLKSKNIRILYKEGRPSYAELFQIAAEEYFGKEIIVANADIYFNQTLHLLEGYDLAGKFLALTRWNVQKDGSLQIYMWPGNRKAEGSQDAWIFLAPLPSLDEAHDIYLGTPHCDGRIAYQAQRAGLAVINPCLSLQACHVHLSGIRHWEPAPYPAGKAIRVPYAYLS